jgi:RNA polymerase sigma-70 factor (ECF subfamily)
LHLAPGAETLFLRHINVGTPDLCFSACRGHCLGRSGREGIMKRAVTTQPAVKESMDLAQHRDAVLGFIWRMVGERDLAEDLTQETLLRAEQKRASFRGQASPGTWLFAIALNACRDHFRAKARNAQRSVDLAPAERLPANVDLEQALAQTEMGSCITGYLFQLPERQREIVALHDMGGLDHQEISRLLGISEPNARVLLHRGRTALRKLLEKHCVLAFDDAVPCEPRRKC